MTAPTRPKENLAFDPDAFIEELRVLSLLDQPEKRALRGKEDEGAPTYNAYPETSGRCIARVVEALRDCPNNSDAITVAVDQFIAKSTGSDQIQLSGAIERPQDLLEMVLSRNNSIRFWQRVAVAASTTQAPEKSGSVDSAIEATGAAAALTVDATL